MEKYEIEKLRGLSIAGVAQRLGLQVNSRRQCLCPFHDDHHPSMSLGRNNQYRCFVCGAHGDTISLVMRYLNKSFPEACRWLADESNIILTEYQPKDDRPPKPFLADHYLRFFEHPWLSDEARRFLFDERRIDPRVVRWCRISSYKDRNGVPWLSVPFYDREWRLIGIQQRNLVKGALPRFRFPAGCDTSLWGMPVLNRLRPHDELYIAEGVSDALSLLSAGHKAIAIPSATLLKHQEAELLRDLASQLELTIGMYPDNDIPGDALLQKLKEVLPGLVRHQLPDTCKDYSDYYLQTRQHASCSPPPTEYLLSCTGKNDCAKKTEPTFLKTEPVF